MNARFVHESGPAPGNAVGFACFSPDRRYRWSLRRAWPGSDRSMTWIMLNPSTAAGRPGAAPIRTCHRLGGREAETCRAFRQAPRRWPGTPPGQLDRMAKHLLLAIVCEHAADRGARWAMSRLPAVRTIKPRKGKHR